ncbi:hypothetical protein AB0M39_18750 [Streptomyces sp. NPDC051907]|uniref:hypothetical protein n=1 Tax=Streptomyces sp. NPDC051907 TaxID=3155284 RepID=UPI0034121BDA
MIDAAGRDFQLYVLSDGIADQDTEVHNFLLPLVVPSRAHIIDTTELSLLDALGVRLPSSLPTQVDVAGRR